MEALVRAQPINHLLKMQVVVLVVTSLIVMVVQDLLSFYAFLYGGIIALNNTLLQRWHLFASAKYAKADAGRNLSRAYRCVAERWVITIIMFAIGFKVIVPVEMMMVSFIVMQAVVLFGNYNRALTKHGK